MKRTILSLLAAILLIGLVEPIGLVGLVGPAGSAAQASPLAASPVVRPQGPSADEQGAIVPELPSDQEVFIVLRDMGLDYQRVQVRTVVPSEVGASALLAFSDGTLLDVELVQTNTGWSLRDVFYVAGSSDTYRIWTGPWRRRVAEAERYLAATEDGDSAGAQRRRAEELASLMWFEDIDESRRLWGLNPTTYRVMSTLQMLPALGGPMNPNRDIRRRN